MKALSIQQPWAWLIVNGIKDIENRDWRTNFRGDFLVHAGKKFDVQSYSELIKPSFFMKLKLPLALEFHLGGIVGIASLDDCLEFSLSDWFCGKYGFRIERQSPLPFFECRGQLNFFDVNYPADLVPDELKARLTVDSERQKL